jgi:hypothetical protein
VGVKERQISALRELREAERPCGLVIYMLGHTKPLVVCKPDWTCVLIHPGELPQWGRQLCRGYPDITGARTIPFTDILEGIASGRYECWMPRH